MDELPEEILQEISKKNYAVCCDESLKDTFSFLCLKCSVLFKELKISGYEKSREFICPHCLKKNSVGKTFLPRLCKFCAEKLHRCQNCVELII